MSHSSVELFIGEQLDTRESTELRRPCFQSPLVFGGVVSPQASTGVLRDHASSQITPVFLTVIFLDPFSEGPQKPEEHLRIMGYIHSGNVY